MADDVGGMQGAGSEADLMNLSRHNIPAICRFPGRGTGFLVSPGLIMTSTRVVGTRQEAGRLKAVFFEGGKRPRVEVALLPNVFYFAAAFPEHLDYCLVACETNKIFNITPVKLPLVQAEWPQVREGDTLFTVEHPVVPGAAAIAADHPAAANAVGEESSPVVVKRFIEILRRKEDRMFVRPQGTYLSAGCPCFNDAGVLVGLLAQFHDDGDALTCCVVSLVTAVKHLFANGRLAKIHQEPLFSDVWATWYVTGDTARIVSILANFPQPALHKEAAMRLFEHAQVRDNVASVIACGGTRVMLDAISKHGTGDAAFTHAGIRALWTVSFDHEDNRAQICEADGVRVVLSCMDRFQAEESILQYCAVILYNLTLAPKTVTDDWTADGVQKIFAAATAFPDAEVLQKFAMGFFQNVVVADVKYGQEMIDKGIVAHSCNVMKKYEKNEYLSEHGVRLVSRIAQCPRYQGNPGLAPCVVPVIEAVLRYAGSNSLRLEGNHALWGLGADPRNRVAIFNHPRGAEALQSSIGVVSATRPVE